MTMRLRYYFRGLAVGIVLTTIIFSIVHSDRKPMTDVQIRQRALALGMIESDSVRLSSLQGESGAQSDGHVGGESTAPGAVSGNDGNVTGESKTPGATGGSGGSDLPGSASAGSEAATGSDGSIPESGSGMTEAESNSAPGSGTDIAGEPESSEQGERAETVTFRIQNGAGSSGVSRDLAAAGLVEDAAAFDTFLCDNGYSKRLRAGTYEIVPGSSEEEIARIITQGR